VIIKVGACYLIALNTPHALFLQARGNRDMRNTRLRKNKSTSAERRFAEILKRNRIPFEAKVMICNREVDFVIGKYAIEISGHNQDTDKNVMLVKAGYIPIHFNNLEVNTLLTNKLKKLC